MVSANALSGPADTRGVVPKIMRHSDPSLRSLPSLVSEMRFDIRDGTSSLVMRVICGTPASCPAPTLSTPNSSPGEVGLCVFTATLSHLPVAHQDRAGL